MIVQIDLCIVFKCNKLRIAVTFSVHTQDTLCIPYPVSELCHVELLR